MATDAGTAATSIIGFFDTVTISVGIVVVVAKIGWRKFRAQKPVLSNRLCGNDLLNGAIIVPFAVMLLAPFSSYVTDMKNQAGGLSIALAGGIGLFFILSELLSPPPPGG